jgi:phospholipid/cholesterol/gamma-HCH transport system substrate-binding protein
VVAARDREISELLTDSDRVLAVLESRRDVIRRVIVGTRELSLELSGLVADNQKALAPALRHLNTVLEVLRDNDQELRDILKYARVYAREFSNVAGTGHWFDATIKAPRNIAVCSVGGTAGLPALLDPLLSQLNEAVNGASTPCLPLGPATGGS